MVRSVRLTQPIPQVRWAQLPGGGVDDAFDGSALRAVLAGAAAGVVGSVVQAAIGKCEEIAFLPEREDSNLAPRLVDRIAGRAGYDPPAAVEWALGTVFHLGYGATWGGLYALARERHPVDPWAGGAAMAGIIYGITFPRWGGAVQTGTERPPRRRSWGMEAVAASVTLGFGLSTALTYERLRRAGTTTAT